MRRAIDRGVPASAIAEYLQGTTAYEYDADNQSAAETIDKAEENNLGMSFSSGSITTACLRLAVKIRFYQAIIGVINRHGLRYGSPDV